MENSDNLRSSPSSTMVNVFITGSQRLVNSLICQYLNSQDIFQASEGPVEDSIKLISSEDSAKPDVVMLDNYSGDVLDKLTKDCEEYLGLLRGIPTIIFNFHYPKRLKKWITYGVRGIIYDKEKPQNMVKAIRTVAEGHMWFPRQAMSNFLDDKWSRSEASLEAIKILTPREIEILSLIAKGKNNDYIAEKLFISPFTVKSHIQYIYKKIGVPNRVKAVIWANENIV